jgi:hypothetical protein
VTLVGFFPRFIRACYQRITALSNLSDPSAEQSVKITSTKDNLEWMWEPREGRDVLLRRIEVRGVTSSPIMRRPTLIEE